MNLTESEKLMVLQRFPEALIRFFHTLCKPEQNRILVSYYRRYFIDNKKWRENVAITHAYKQMLENIRPVR